MNENKKPILLIVFFIIVAIIVICFIPKSILQDKSIIKVSIMDGGTGNTYETTKKEEIESIIECFNSQKVRTSFRIPLTGGYAYTVDITYQDNSIDELVIVNSNKIEINDSTYKLYGKDNFPNFEELSKYITQ